MLNTDRRGVSLRGDDASDVHAVHMRRVGAAASRLLSQAIRAAAATAETLLGDDATRDVRVQWLDSGVEYGDDRAEAAE